MLLLFFNLAKYSFSLSSIFLFSSSAFFFISSILFFEILLYFLQRLENSKGINIFIKKKGSTSNIQKITFLPSKNSIEEIKKKAEEENKKIEEREK